METVSAEAPRYPAYVSASHTVNSSTGFLCSTRFVGKIGLDIDKFVADIVATQVPCAWACPLESRAVGSTEGCFDQGARMEAPW